MNTNENKIKNWNDEWNKFVTFLRGRKGIKIDSGIKSRHKFIYIYFIQENREFTIETVTELLYGLMEGTVGKSEKLKASAVNKYITVLKHIAKQKGLDFMDDFETYSVDEPPITVIDPKIQIEIAECYIKRTRLERKDNYRYKCVIYTLIFTGMRVQELCDLQWSDYTGNTVQIKTSKNKKPRIIPIASKLQALLNSLPRVSPYIFGSIRSKLKPATVNKELAARCRKLGLTTTYTAKHFRSSFDTLVSVGGGEATLPKIARITGHSMETAYKYYTRYDINVLRDALESAHPLLKSSQDIDTLKRTLLDVVKKIVDLTKFNVSLEITAKEKDSRKLHIS